MEVIVKSRHFTASYRLQGIAVFTSRDGLSFQEVGQLQFPEDAGPGIGTHSWEFGEIDQLARYVRVALLSKWTTTIGEVEILVCDGIAR